MKQALGGRRWAGRGTWLGHYGYADMSPPLQWHINTLLRDHSDLTHSLYRCLLTN